MKKQLDFKLLKLARMDLNHQPSSIWKTTLWLLSYGLNKRAKREAREECLVKRRGVHQAPEILKARNKAGNWFPLPIAHNCLYDMPEGNYPVWLKPVAEKNKPRSFPLSF